MNASVLRNGNRAHHYTKTIWKRHSISDSIGAPFHRTHVQQQLQRSKAFYSRFPGRKTKEMEFSVSVRSASSNTNGTTSSITNSGLIGWYLGMIKTRPILTKSITSALIYTAADLSSQTMTRSSSEPYDFIRTSRMAGYGMIILGPSLHFWFNFVSRLFPKRDLITTFKKMFMGQALYGPIMTAVFFSVNAGLQGERGKEIIARLKRDMLPTMINNALYWPICDFITFRFIPVHLQPLVSNSFVCMDGLHYIHGELRKSRHQLIEHQLLCRAIHYLYELLLLLSECCRNGNHLTSIVGKVVEAQVKIPHNSTLCKWGCSH